MKFLFLIALFFQVQGFAQPQDYAEYIRKYGDIAMQEQLRSGIPASITLAQGLLESGAGKGNLVLRSNNHFGIKCKSTWTGATALHDDDARNECFRAYPTAAESYRDHSDFLKGNTRYTFLFDYEVTDYKAWANGLRKAGYATNPRYPAMLIKVIEENNLHAFTELALTRTWNMNDWASNPVNTELAAPPSAEPDAMNTVIQSAPENHNLQRRAADTKIQAYPEGLFRINDLKVVYAKAGTSMLALAGRYQLAVGQLFAFNDMSRQDILDSDQLVFLEKKKKTGSKEFHEVLPGETIWGISQAEGMRMDQLMDWNNLVSNISLQVGMKLTLHGPGSRP